MIVVAYGANLDSQYGNPIQTFEIAKRKLNNCGINILQSSSLYDTSPVGTDKNQPRYTNAVLNIQTDKTPDDLLKTLLDIEKDIGRTRDKQNEPRVIDLDLIAYNNEVIKDDILILPHPRMHERKFVLYPLHEINSHWVHPVNKMTVENLMQSLPDEQEISKIAA
jgi:2-amino-4-hydroxy-6-hydroxymethyldihydropteridine diphosphokinase